MYGLLDRLRALSVVYSPGRRSCPNGVPLRFGEDSEWDGRPLGQEAISGELTCLPFRAPSQEVTRFGPGHCPTLGTKLAGTGYITKCHRAHVT